MEFLNWVKNYGIRHYLAAVLIVLFFDCMYFYHIQELIDTQELHVILIIGVPAILILINILLIRHIFEIYRRRK